MERERKIRLYTRLSAAGFWVFALFNIITTLTGGDSDGTIFGVSLLQSICCVLTGVLIFQKKKNMLLFSLVLFHSVLLPLLVFLAGIVLVWQSIGSSYGGTSARAIYIIGSLIGSLIGLGISCIVYSFLLAAICFAAHPEKHPAGLKHAGWMQMVTWICTCVIALVSFLGSIAARPFGIALLMLPQIAGGLCGYIGLGLWISQEAKKSMEAMGMRVRPAAAPVAAPVYVPAAPAPMPVAPVPLVPVPVAPVAPVSPVSAPAAPAAAPVAPAVPAAQETAAAPAAHTPSGPCR